MPTVKKLHAGIGDSNRVGQTDTDKLDSFLNLKAAYPAIQYNRHYATSYADPVSWIDLATTDLKPYGSGGSPGAGDELSMGREFNATGAATFICVMGINGTTAEQWKPTGNTPVSGGTLFNQWKTYVHSMETASGSTLGSVSLELGTNDAATLTDANNYAANLAAIVAAIRVEFGSSTVIGMVKTNAACVNSYTSVVRAAQVAYAATDPLFALVDCDDLTLLPDGLHYSANGYTTRGQRVAYAISDKLGIARPQVSTANPQIVGSETAQFGSGDVSPSAWAGGVEGDTEILIAVAGFANNTPSLTVPAGFTQVNSTILSNFSTFYERLSVYTRKVVEASKVNGRMPTPTVHGNNTECAARIMTVRGKDGLVNVESSQGSQNNNYATSGYSATGLTTSHNDALVLNILGGFSGSGLNSLTEANATLTGFAEYGDGLYFATADYVVITVAAGTLPTAGSTGNTTVTSATNAILAGLTVSLYTPTLVSIAVTPSTPSISVGDTQQMTATGTYSDASTLNITNLVTWASTDTGVLTVSASGLVTGAAAGSATISATHGAVGSTLGSVTNGTGQALFDHALHALPRWLTRGKTTALEWLYAFRDVFTAAQSQGSYWIGITYLDTATGAALDQHARDRGTSRRLNENDATLRARLKNITDSVTEPALKASVDNILSASGLGQSFWVVLRRDAAHVSRRDAFLDRGYRIGGLGIVYTSVFDPSTGGTIQVPIGSVQTYIVILPTGTTPAIQKAIQEYLRQYGPGGFNFIVELSP